MCVVAKGIDFRMIPLHVVQVPSRVPTGCVLSCDVHEKYEDLKSSDLPLRRPTLETELCIVHAALIAGHEKEIYDFPEHTCICCEYLHQRKSASVVSLSDDFECNVWDELKAYVLKYQPTVAGQVLYMCHYCKTRFRSVLTLVKYPHTIPFRLAKAPCFSFLCH